MDMLTGRQARIIKAGIRGGDGQVTIGGYVYDEDDVRAAIEGVLDTTSGEPVQASADETVVTLPDGRELRISGPATVMVGAEGVELHGETRTAAPVGAQALTSPLPPEGAMTMADPDGEQEDPNADLPDRVTAVEGSVQDLQAQMQGVLQFIQAVTQSNVASALAVLDEEEQSRLAAALGVLDDAEAALHPLDNGICTTCARVAAGAAPYGNVEYADPGYQDDKQKRYPLDTRAHVRNALSRIGDPDNADKYKAADLAKVKAAIVRAAKRMGIQVSTDAKAAA